MINLALIPQMKDKTHPSYPGSELICVTREFTYAYSDDFELQIPSSQVFGKLLTENLGQDDYLFYSKKAWKTHRMHKAAAILWAGSTLKAVDSKGLKIGEISQAATIQDKPFQFLLNGAKSKPAMFEAQGASTYVSEEDWEDTLPAPLWDFVSSEGGQIGGWIIMKVETTVKEADAEALGMPLDSFTGGGKVDQGLTPDVPEFDLGARFQHVQSITEQTAKVLIEQMQNIKADYGDGERYSALLNIVTWLGRDVAALTETLAALNERYGKSLSKVSHLENDIEDLRDRSEELQTENEAISSELAAADFKEINLEIGKLKFRTDNLQDEAFMQVFVDSISAAGAGAVRDLLDASFL